MLYRCPASFLTADISSFLRAAQHVENGVLPCSGGLFDQAASFVDALTVLGQERAAIHEGVRPKKK